MIKKIIFILIFIAAILSSSIHANCFDKEPGSIKINEEPEFSHVKITTIGSALGLAPTSFWSDIEEAKWKKSKGSFLLQGVGFVIKGGYIITAAHVVNPGQIVTNPNKYSHYIDKPIKIIHRSIIITAGTEIDRIEYGTYAEIYYLDIKHDIAILKFDPENIYDSLPYELYETKYLSEDVLSGFCNLIQPGDSVAMIARCRDKNRKWAVGFEIRYGKIISVGIEGIPRNNVPVFNMNDFTTDIIVHPGDSGSAVFAFSFGKPVIIGIARANNDYYSPFGRELAKENPRSYVTRIDFVKKILESR